MTWVRFNSVARNCVVHCTTIYTATLVVALHSYTRPSISQLHTSRQLHPTVESQGCVCAYVTRAMFSTFSHRRSCSGCVKAKRRCDQRSPRCTRCTGKAAICVYENTPLTQSQAGLSPPTPATTSLIRVRLHEPEHTMKSSSTPAAIDESTVSLAAPPNYTISLDLGFEPSLPEIKWRNNNVTIFYLASKLQEFPTTFVKEG